MPCQCDYMYGSGDNEREQEYKDTINELGQHLCFLCGELQYDDLLKKYTNDSIQKWWAQHKKKDTSRVSKQIRARYKKKSAEKTADELIAAAKKVHAVSRFHLKWFHDLAKRVYKQMSEKENEKAMQNEFIKKAKNKLTKEERKALGVK